MNSEKAAFAFGLAASTAAAVLVSTLAIRWAVPLSVFGEHLPISAAVALILAPWTFALPAAVALAWVLGRPGKRPLGLVVSIGLFAIIAGAAFTIAMWLPLFKLSAAT